MKYWRLSGVEVVGRAAPAYLARLVFSILKDFYLACMKCWVPPPNPIKLDMVAHICDAEGSGGVRGHLQQHNKFEAILGYTRPCHKNKEKS